MAKQKTVYCCTECGGETPNWAGKCPSCGAWNTLQEMRLEARASKRGAGSVRASLAQRPRRISELDSSEELRFSTGISEFDRVLGGGAVAGSLILVGGAPGIGKSTLLLQMCAIAGREKTILYVSGEESERQLKLRAMRLGVESAEVYVLAETELDNILVGIDELKPDIVIIDSIQTMSDSEVASAPGSISQVRECTMRIMRVTKEKGLTVFVVGHINKEGSIAGPKVLEHMVDCVLYFEGERNTSFRILRAAKNRFGSTNEIGVFEMTESGLASPGEQPRHLRGLRDRRHAPHPRRGAGAHHALQLQRRPPLQWHRLQPQRHAARGAGEKGRDASRKLRFLHQRHRRPVSG